MVAALDLTGQHLVADGVLLLLIVVNAVLGWRTGAIRRMLAFVGLYAGIVAAYYTGNGFAALLHKGDIFTNAWVFIAIVAVVVIVFEILGRVLSERLERLAVVAFDRVAGTIIGAAVGFFQVLVLFWVAVSVGAAPSLPTNTIPPSRNAPANAVNGAALSGRAVRAVPALQRILSPMLNPDLSAHLADGTQSTS